MSINSAIIHSSKEYTGITLQTVGSNNYKAATEMRDIYSRTRYNLLRSSKARVA